jgi:hypothetical protein
MKIDELYGIKNDPDIAHFKDATADIEKYNFTERREVLLSVLMHLQSKGFETINNGSFGVVFTKPGLDYVIKVFKNDPGYLHFIDYCQKNKGNKHLPTFRGKLIKIDEKHFIARVERLSTANKFQAIVLSVLAKAPLKAEDFDNFIEEVIENATKQRRTAHVEAANRVEAYINTQRGILKTRENVINGRGSFNLDLHAGNFMFRGDTIVIVDPYFDKSVVGGLVQQ